VLTALLVLAATWASAPATLPALVLIAVGAGVRPRRTALTSLAAGAAAWLVAVAAQPGSPPFWRAAAEVTAVLLVATALATVRARFDARSSALRSQLRERDGLAVQATDRLQILQVDTNLMIDASPVGIAVSDDQGRWVSVNPALCTLLGRAPEDLLGRTAAPFTHPDDRSDRDRAGQRIEAAADGIARSETRFVRPDGSIRWAWLTLTHLPRGEGAAPWTLAHVQDITERHAAEAAIRDSEATLAAVASVVRDIRQGGDVRSGILGAIQDIAGSSTASFIEPETVEDIGTAARPAGLVISRSSRPDLTGIRVPLDSTSATVEAFCSGTPMFVADPADNALLSPVLLRLSGARSILWQPVTERGVTRAVIAVTWDDSIESISDQRAAAVALLADEAAVSLANEELLVQLRGLAGTDALTGLANRRAWDAALPQLLAVARRDGRPLTVAMADLDHFKRFNDTHGHQAGDDLLTAFSAACTADLRQPDLIARWGGEEFAIALPSCDGDQAGAVLDRLRAAVPFGQTCSFGYATWDTVETAAELLARADAALYRAKAAGRDRSERAVQYEQAATAHPFR
jgi:diguanylate cyclase (GGDEF)-like protein/PAS domain S-box-containing protein